jgi:V/A-type H+-transporting ATPase subunit C
MSHAYAVARIRALEKYLLSSEKLARMAEGSMDDVWRLLQESDYCGPSDATAADVEKLLANERERTAALVREISPEPGITDLFLLPADIHNLKVLLKARMMDGAEESLMLGSVYAFETLRAAVQAGDYRALPASLNGALAALEKKLASGPDPQAVSVALDKAYMSHVFSVLDGHKNALARQYFKALADFDNVLCLLRLRNMKAGAEALASSLLPPGDIAHSALIAAFDAPFEALAKLVCVGECRDALIKALDAVQRLGSAGAVEKARDDYLIRLVKKHKHDAFTLSPVIGYLLAREREAKSVRLILAGKRNGVVAPKIPERLCELYG